MQAKLWLVKINWRHKELELIVGKGAENSFKLSNRQKSGCPFALFTAHFPVGWVTTDTHIVRCFFLLCSFGRLVLLATLYLLACDNLSAPLYYCYSGLWEGFFARLCMEVFSLFSVIQFFFLFKNSQLSEDNDTTHGDDNTTARERGIVTKGKKEEKRVLKNLWWKKMTQRTFIHVMCW